MLNAPLLIEAALIHDIESGVGARVKGLDGDICVDSPDQGVVLIDRCTADSRARSDVVEIAGFTDRVSCGHLGVLGHLRSSSDQGVDCARVEIDSGGSEFLGNVGDGTGGDVGLQSNQTFEDASSSDGHAEDGAGENEGGSV